MARGLDDPEERALLYVQQWLKEMGYTQALASLEKECGLLYDEDKYPRASELLQLIYDQMERELTKTAASDDNAADASARARAAEERELLQGGQGDDLPVAPAHTIAGAHAANILAVRLWPGRDLLATGSADGLVQLLRFDGGQVWSTRVATGGALSLDWSPGIADAPMDTAAAGSTAGSAGIVPPPSQQLPEGLDGMRQATERQQQQQPQQPHLLAVGSMDGTVSVLDAITGAVLASAKVHDKYVVRVAFDPRSWRRLATASFDQSCCVLRLTDAGGSGTTSGPERSGNGAGSSSGGAQDANSGSGSGDSSGGAGLRLEVVRRVPQGAAVQDVAFLPPSASPACRVAVAVRGRGALGLLDGATGQSLDPVPLHSADDDRHLFVSPMRLAFSPCGRFLLVALDGPRMLMLRTSDWSRARAFFGLHVAQFHNHALAWHRDSYYVYATAEHAAVHAYHVGTGKLAARLEGHHRGNVRDVDVDAGRNLLATASFDRTVKVFAAAGRGGA